MKKTIYLSAVLAAYLMAGCSLDENPESAFDESNAYSTSTLMYANIVASVYSSIGNSIYGNDGSSVHTLQEFSSDASMIPGRQGDWVDGGKWENMFLHNFDPSLNSYADVWNNCYRIIGLCNSGIEKLDKVKETNENADVYICELRALRAIEYYYAMDLYGRVPIVTKSSTPLSSIDQSSRGEVFKFVVNELVECLPNLSDAMSQNMNNYYGRITKGIAYMCLAKCALNSPLYNIDPKSKNSYAAFVGDDYSKDCKASESLGANVSSMGKSINIKCDDGQTRNAWETVIYCVDKLTGLGYSLQPNYRDNFCVSNEKSVENIFTRPNDTKTYRIQDFNICRSMHYNHASAAGWQGWNGACSSTHQMRILGYGTENQDPRLNMNFYTDKDYTEDTKGKTVDDGVGGKLEYLPMAAIVDFPSGYDLHKVKCAGARFKKYELDKSSAEPNIANNDLVIWRYGDALLMKAEAEYRLGNSSEAMSIINQVRSRVNATPITTIDLNTILNERMAELSWESVRRQDQIRFCTFTQPTEDRYIGVQHASEANDYNDDKDGYTCVFPIPKTIISNNSKLTQNPGY